MCACCLVCLLSRVPAVLCACCHVCLLSCVPAVLCACYYRVPAVLCACYHVCLLLSCACCLVCLLLSCACCLVCVCILFVCVSLCPRVGILAYIIHVIYCIYVSCTFHISSSELRVFMVINWNRNWIELVVPIVFLSRVIFASAWQYLLFSLRYWITPTFVVEIDESLFEKKKKNKGNHYLCLLLESGWPDWPQSSDTWPLPGFLPRFLPSRHNLKRSNKETWSEL